MASISLEKKPQAETWGLSPPLIYSREYRAADVISRNSKQPAKAHPTINARPALYIFIAAVFIALPFGSSVRVAIVRLLLCWCSRTRGKSDLFFVFHDKKLQVFRCLYSSGSGGGRAGALIGHRRAELRKLPLTATSQLVTTSIYIQESGQK